ncbi:putative CoA-transferase family III domain-containing protein [Seiridium cardinale]|uniref:CoA-transferase family III domain-containing protein n=1 Tax=Seiridium cardinale TaxID=138064 RepID=A0ABR2Y9Z2_9PEZI
MSYNLQQESSRILQDVLLKDPLLELPESFAKAAEKVRFVGGDSQPFIPTPCKITESISALNALLAVAASVVAKDRFGVDFQDIEVNTDISTLFLMSIVLSTLKGKPTLEDAIIKQEIAKGDLYLMQKPIHRQCTNVYQTKDGRWYHLHGSMNAKASMEMMGVPEQDVSNEEAKDIYSAKVAQWDSAEIERVANEDYKQAGVVCNKPEEFFASEQGRIMGKEPLYTLKPLKATKKPWPASPNSTRPLAGIRVIDYSRVIAAPVISKMLALLGAEVIKVTSSGLPDISITWVDLNAGKKDCDLNLKTDEGRVAFRELIASADVLIDGYRPGVLERLGFSSASLREINSSLIYVRENCYGFKGPLQGRSGWQQISDCLVGISWLQGEFLGLNEPVVPLLRKFGPVRVIAYAHRVQLTHRVANSDYQVGVTGAVAVIHALLERANKDTTFDIDVSLTQYNIWYYRLGQYTREQQDALRQRNQGLELRHHDEMNSLIAKTHAALRACRPDIFAHPEYFTSIPGNEWGVDGDINILAAPMKLSRSVLKYDVPSGARGRSEPRWA